MLSSAIGGYRQLILTSDLTVAAQRQHGTSWPELGQLVWDTRLWLALEYPSATTLLALRVPWHVRVFSDLTLNSDLTLVRQLAFGLGLRLVFLHPIATTPSTRYVSWHVRVGVDLTLDSGLTLVRQHFYPSPISSTLITLLLLVSFLGARDENIYEHRLPSRDRETSTRTLAPFHRARTRRRPRGTHSARRSTGRGCGYNTQTRSSVLNRTAAISSTEVPNSTLH